MRRARRRPRHRARRRRRPAADGRRATAALYDGDQLLYVIALDYWRRGALAGGVVGTLMSNLGFEQALARARHLRSRARAVGDRYVLEMMQREGLAARRREFRATSSASTSTRPATRSSPRSRCCARCASRRRRSPQATADAPLFPQRLINVPIRRGFDWRGERRDPARRARRGRRRSTAAGRVLLRPSGTEPVLRVMVEAREAARGGHARAAISPT